MKRYLEIDFMKGIAIILMIFFHIFYLMNNMGFNKISSSSKFMKIIAKISHITFITLAGTNFYISFKKYKKNKKIFYNKQIKRSLKLFFFAWSSNTPFDVIMIGFIFFVIHWLRQETTSSVFPEYDDRIINEAFDTQAGKL